MEYMSSFKKNVKEGAAIGAIAGAAMTADTGNPLVNAAVGAGIGAIGGAVGHLKNRRQISSSRTSSFHDSVNAQRPSSFVEATKWMK